MRCAPVHVQCKWTCGRLHDYNVCYICLLNTGNWLMKKNIKIKIQCIQNEIHFKERLSTMQILIKWSQSCLARSMSLDILRILSYSCCQLFFIQHRWKKKYIYFNETKWAYLMATTRIVGLQTLYLYKLLHIHFILNFAQICWKAFVCACM